VSDRNSVRTAATSAEIEALRRRIDAWREQKRWRGEPMPADLWRRAGQLAARQGVNRVSAALKLNYDRLREEARPAENRAGPEVSFIELAGRRTGEAAITIAVERADAKLKIELRSGGSDAVIVEVLSRFLSRRA
jgi:hypothetical protein